jgi:hypothetical protein
MIAQSVADILGNHVKLSVEGIDRMYLNVYVPRLQTEQGNRKVTNRTPGRFRTRIITQDVTPLTERLLQKCTHQAVSQRKSSFAHRDHDQQHLRFRYR